MTTKEYRLGGAGGYSMFGIGTVREARKHLAMGAKSGSV